MADTATAEIPIVDIPVADVSISSASEGDEYEDVTNSLWACLLAAMLALQVGAAYHFDTRGDLTLKVGGDQSAYEFVVCSRTLGRSSPVFQAMLFNDLTESKPSDGAAWNVQLPDDDPSPIFLILSIIHGHFQHVTRTLREKQLYEVLVVTEKYDMTKILNPLASTWFAPYEEFRFLGSDETFPLLWSSWELGHIKAFSRFAAGLMVRQPINVEGELVTGHKTLRRLSGLPYRQPPGLIESIAQGRRDLIGKITTLLNTTILRLCAIPLCNGKPSVQCNVCGSVIGHGDVDHPTWCSKCKCNRGTTKDFHLSPSLCGDLIFGSLSRRVAAIGLKEVAFLETPTPDYRFSVEELSKDIRAMIIDLPEEHKECNPLPALRDEMQQLLDCAYAPVTDAHMQYLESQAKKTGIQDMPCGVNTAKEDEPEPVPRPFWECLKPATSTIECGKAFSFDPIGDLTLRVGEDVVAYEFIVCSRTLSRWSPVFCTMLFGGFAESRPADAAWSVSLPEDLPSAMFLVLSIIHGCFEHVPTSLSQIELYQTLVATEKYDMTKIVRPWATAWFAPYKNISKVSSNEILLWISWELGYADNFCWLAKDLLLSSPVNGNEQLIGQDGVVLSTYSCLEPPEILEEVTSRRKRIVDTMVGCIYKTLEAAFGEPECRGQPQNRECPKCYRRYEINMQECTHCSAGPYDLGRVALKKSSLTLPPHMCKALVFGSLAKEVSKMLGQDVALMKKPIPHLQQSINYLLLMIDCMEVDVLAEHQACNPLPATQKVIRAVVESVTSPVKSLHLEYLKEQAKKTGV
ncbi:hypothetical protein CGCF413_v010432 [Colletotrichum fructicola]|nr:hypothetical protein CGCF413_v010432 [Colletotrichum fructicola]